MIDRPGIAAILLALTTPTVADAATVVIWPVYPVLSGAQQATALWLENRGESAVTLQVRSLGWSQDGGSDATQDQDDVIASPPIARVGPGQRQLVRIIRRQPATAAQEQSYRLLVDELPAPPGVAPSEGASAQLSVKMRYSIPLFVQPSAAAPRPQLAARIAVRGTERVLEISNAGTGRARLTDLTVGTGPHRTIVQPGLVGYVLAGATMSWPMPAGPAGDGISITVNGVDQTLLPTS